MKLLSFLEDGQPRIGCVDGDRVLSLGEPDAGVPTDLQAAIAMSLDFGAAASRARARGAPHHALDDIRPGLPIASPGKIVCLGLNYHDHAAEGGRPPPDYPWFFLRAASSLMAHGEPALVPRVSRQLDWEAELVLVIGRRMPRHTPREETLDFVFGYSCFNDFSVRDYQKKTPQWTVGKNFDATGAFGPWIVTADELPPGAASLAIRGRLDGQVVQEANTRDMIFDVRTTLALLAEAMTLEPGDLVVMGTPAGVGQSRTPPVWLAPGQRFEVEIEGIGTLANPVRAEGDTAPHPLPKGQT